MQSTFAESSVFKAIEGIAWWAVSITERHYSNHNWLCCYCLRFTSASVSDKRGRLCRDTSSSHRRRSHRFNITLYEQQKNNFDEKREFSRGQLIVAVFAKNGTNILRVMSPECENGQFSSHKMFSPNIIKAVSLMIRCAKWYIFFIKCDWSTIWWDYIAIVLELNASRTGFICSSKRTIQ